MQGPTAGNGLVSWDGICLVYFLTPPQVMHLDKGHLKWERRSMEWQRTLRKLWWWTKKVSKFTTCPIRTSAWSLLWSTQWLTIDFNRMNLHPLTALKLYMHLTTSLNRCLADYQNFLGSFGCTDDWTKCQFLIKCRDVSFSSWMKEKKKKKGEGIQNNRQKKKNLTKNSSLLIDVLFQVKSLDRSY